MFRIFLQTVGIAGIAVFVYLAFSSPTMPEEPTVAYIRQAYTEAELEQTATSSIENIEEIPSEIEVEVESIAAEPEPVPKAKPKPSPAPAQQAAAAQSQDDVANNQVQRTVNPYPYPSKSQEDLDTLARGAIVNLYCESKGGPLSSISGSGVFIDGKGVILTNAHVAQYFLLATSPEINLNCFIRTGSPAQNRWKADILYFPSDWVREHAADIAKTRPKGTGEFDYALLAIKESVDGTPLPEAFPALPFDTREAIAFTSDTVLLAGYPTEFSSGSTARSALYPTSVFTRIGDLLTFTDRSVDLISLGSVPLAQSGSSGGAVVNSWGTIVGIITTTSEGATTAQRTLRAVTLSYIDRDIQDATGANLPLLVPGDVRSKAALFMNKEVPALAQQIISHLP